MILILRLGRIGLHFWRFGGGGGAELFLGTWRVKANTFGETRKLFAGRRGDQCIIFREQGSTDPQGDSLILTLLQTEQILIRQLL